MYTLALALLAALQGGLRYTLEMDPSSVPGSIERFGVRFPAEPLST